MKNFKLSILAVACLITIGTVNAQKSIENIDMKKDFEVTAKGLIKKSETIVPVKVAIHFKTITNGKATVGKGQNRTSSTAWAILNGVSEETMQAIADEFATSLNNKLKDINLSIVDYEKVESTKIFPKIEEKQLKKYWDNKNEGAITIKTANGAPHNNQVVGNPGIWMSYAKLGKELKANPVTMDIVVDFANFNIKMKRNYGYSYTSTSASAQMFPEISIQASTGGTGFSIMRSNFTIIGKYGEASLISLKKDINFNHNIAESVEDYSGQIPASMKKMISFGQSLDTGSFVVNADEAEYKKAVLGALEEYADLILMKIKEVRK